MSLKKNYKVKWAGFESDTKTLQKNGWRITKKGKDLLFQGPEGIYGYCLDFCGDIDIACFLNSTITNDIKVLLGKILELQADEKVWLKIKRKKRWRKFNREVKSYEERRSNQSPRKGSPAHKLWRDYNKV